jgi:hypothetical protein
MNIGDRICLATGICRVLSILPEGQRIELFKAFVSPTLDWLTSLTQIIQIDKQALQKDALFAQIGDEIHLLSSMTKHYSASITKDMPIDDSQIEFIDRAQIPRPVLEIIHRAWPSIIYVASHFVDNEVNAFYFDSTDCFKFDLTSDNRLPYTKRDLRLV